MMVAFVFTDVPPQKMKYTMTDMFGDNSQWPILYKNMYPEGEFKFSDDLNNVELMMAGDLFPEMKRYVMRSNGPSFMYDKYSSDLTCASNKMVLEWFLGFVKEHLAHGQFHMVFMEIGAKAETKKIKSKTIDLSKFKPKDRKFDPKFNVVYTFTK